MPLELTAGLVAVVVVGAWWLMSRRTRRRDEPFPEVPDAPPGAESIGGWRVNRHGLGTYNLELRETGGQVEQEGRSSE